MRWRRRARVSSTSLAWQGGAGRMRAAGSGAGRGAARSHATPRPAARRPAPLRLPHRASSAPAPHSACGAAQRPRGAGGGASGRGHARVLLRFAPAATAPASRLVVADVVAPPLLLARPHRAGQRVDLPGRGGSAMFFTGMVWSFVTGKALLAAGLPAARARARRARRLPAPRPACRRPRPRCAGRVPPLPCRCRRARSLPIDRRCSVSSPGRARPARSPHPMCAPPAPRIERTARHGTGLPPGAGRRPWPRPAPCSLWRPTQAPPACPHAAAPQRPRHPGAGGGARRAHSVARAAAGGRHERRDRFWRCLLSFPTARRPRSSRAYPAAPRPAPRPPRWCTRRSHGVSPGNPEALASIARPRSAPTAPRRPARPRPAAARARRLHAHAPAIPPANPPPAVFGVGVVLAVAVGYGLGANVSARGGSRRGAARAGRRPRGGRPPGARRAQP
jgi:hypothetical protein